MRTRKLESSWLRWQPAPPLVRLLECPGIQGLSLHEVRYPPGLDVRAHAHDGGLLCVVLRGGFKEWNNRNCLMAGPGGMTFQPAGEVHRNRVGSSGLYGLRLEVSPDRLATLPALAQPRATLAWGRGAWLARALLDEVAHGARTIPAAVEALALLLLAEVAPRGQDVLRYNPPWLRQVRERLEAEFRKVPSLAELARGAGVHPAHLARAFSRQYGVTIGEFAREQRLSLARTLLLTTRTPLVEVAARCGFADQSHLGRDFKRRYGRTPRTFRLDGL
jgi:AraC family transcriptional regulator